MLSILSILSFIKNGVYNNDDRFNIVDHEHVLDTKTGVKLHMYPDWFKLTYDDNVIAKMNDFSPQEQQVIDEIRQVLITPEQEKYNQEQYPIKQKERRAKLSSLFENPVPIAQKHPIVEDDAVEYTG